MIPRWTLAALVVVALGALAVASVTPAGQQGAPALRGSEERPEPGQRDAEHALGAVTSDVRMLQRQLAGLQEELRATRAAAQAAPALPTPEPEGWASRPADLDVPAIRAGFDAAFDAEAMDVAWASQEQRKIGAVFAGSSVPGARLEKVECRESLCRVQTRFDSSRDREAFLVSRIGEPPLDHGAFYQTNYETEQVTLFLAREGHPLPDLNDGLEP